jgi:hypothetical protein
MSILSGVIDIAKSKLGGVFNTTVSVPLVITAESVTGTTESILQTSKESDVFKGTINKVKLGRTILSKNFQAKVS